MLKDFEKDGVLSLKDLMLPSDEQLRKGVAIIECVQHIPCNPCVDACPVDAISMKNINDIPIVDFDRCIGCGKCVGVCPGLAIFVIKKVDDKARITLPYEFLPIPKKDENIDVLNRKGEPVGKGLVKKIIKHGKTWVVTVEVDEKLSMIVRNIKV